jgi:hypothetical protein
VTVIVEPAFFALTRTPSMAPSSTELTRPESAAVWELCARPGAAWKEIQKTKHAIAKENARTFIPP